MKDYYYQFPTESNLFEIMTVIENCENNVYFESDEGDRIALKSTLGQFIFFSLNRLPDLSAGAHIHCLGEHDKLLLSRVLIPAKP